MIIKSTRAAFGDRQQLDRPADAATAAEIIAWARKRDLAVRWTTAPEMDSMTASLRLGVQEQQELRDLDRRNVGLEEAEELVREIGVFGRHQLPLGSSIEARSLSKP
jgi:hypothetical protein